MQEMKDKVIIITGASSGIGRATARKLAQEGATVVLAARREDRLKELTEEIQTLGGNASYKVTDVTSREDVEALASYALEKYGQIDVLFNNAGIMPFSYMKNNRVEEWDRMIDVNIKGVLHGVGAVLPQCLRETVGILLQLPQLPGMASSLQEQYIAQRNLPPE